MWKGHGGTHSYIPLPDKTAGRPATLLKSAGASATSGKGEELGGVCCSLAPSLPAFLRHSHVTRTLSHTYPHIQIPRMRFSYIILQVIISFCLKIIMLLLRFRRSMQINKNKTKQNTQHHLHMRFYLGTGKRARDKTKSLISWIFHSKGEAGNKQKNR